MSNEKDLTAVRTPEFRVSFPKLFKAESYGDQDPKFEITMLFDKKTNLDVLHEAVRQASIEKWGENEKKWPKRHLPFRKGEEKSDLEGYPGSIFVIAKSQEKYPPVVMLRDKTRLTKESKDFSAGDYAEAVIKAYAYENEFKTGVSFDLRAVRKLRDGEAFGGRSQEVIETEIDDMLSDLEPLDDDGDSDPMFR